MAETLTQDEIVSSTSEQLILVNSEDEEIGTMDKDSCHDGDGLLHRAFSLFIFNAQGKLLVQQRHPSKRLWPMYWSNSCCSHPRQGEHIDEAVHRRLEQELGLASELEFRFKFEYTAPFGLDGTEHELCSVYIGRTDATPIINTTEINDWRWVAPQELDSELSANGDRYTPWLKIEWDRLRPEFHR